MNSFPLTPKQPEVPEVPVGTIMFFALSKAPAGFLACDGSYVECDKYARLYSAIGKAYGALIEEDTKFQLPNLINRTIWGGSINTTDWTQNYKEAGLPNITGTSGQYIAVNNNNSGALGFTDSTISYPSNEGAAQQLTNRTTTLDASLSNAIYGNSTTVQPPAVVLLPCIKY